ncbi:helix-turn-helix domain-containing protein [Texcoconibacillus texcoconensis]|uniref:Uncharacterized protein YpbB n=1 Tax=Texcoconibacillus texcoconensis TaxID=1095777 RepID=A0A840QNH0_9BACI|nr:helix-turn-helix domain-containing protein [Texcoconibacillus texcoconensis]MBB5172932.1 uncharacterized protein YpbB [Texcoconibacillus texcoconensis]
MDLYRFGLLLYIIDHFRGQRTFFGAYHLLVGKKSAQSIQDGPLYGVESLFGVLPYLKKDHVEEIRRQMLNKGFIVEDENRMTTITEEGRQFHNHQRDHKPIPESLAGGEYEFSGQADWFWRRLVLFWQSLSYARHNDYTFLPIDYDRTIQTWVKKHFPRNKEGQSKWAKQLFHELSTFLQSIDDLRAEVFTRKLSGYQHVGETVEQLGETFDYDADYVYLLLRSTIHELINTIRENPQNFRALAEFVMPLEANSSVLTDSANITRRHLFNGLAIDEIAKERGLKRSTIEDHIVEMAYRLKDFPISAFVSYEDQKEIWQAAKQQDTKRLKQIKEEISADIDYFAIRLSLSKIDKG